MSDAAVMFERCRSKKKVAGGFHEVVARGP
jgi:hypothetical protein